MKLILTSTVDKLGIAGDVVEVKDGYGRNYLVPQGKAIRWTRGAEKQIEGIKRSRDAREVRGVEHAQEIRSQLEGLTITVAPLPRAGPPVRLDHDERRRRRREEGRWPHRRQARGVVREAREVARQPHRSHQAARRRHRARPVRGRR